MIRIDEIYNNTFWPYLKKSVPHTKLIYCYPFGRTDPESLVTNGKNEIGFNNYILFHDQEPIHLDIHKNLFDTVQRENIDLGNSYMDTGTQKRAIVTSEYESVFVDQLCSQYQWNNYYYFFHGWAALDWYRGYDKTFLIKNLNERRIKKTFISPNRIIAGLRSHRLEMLYWIFKLKLLNNHISCPTVCPSEGIPIQEAIKPLESVYPDVASVFSSVNLPLQFAGEKDHPMHSCWLSLFDQCHESLLYLVTETVAKGQRQHLTEKTFKPIAHGMPFIIIGTKGSLKYLRSYGFKTFEGIWDESYDDADDNVRITRIASLLRSLDELPQSGRQDLFNMAIPIIEHNWNHFYNGGFEKILWAELQGMLNTIQNDFR